MSGETFDLVPVDEENAKHVGTVFRSVYGDDFPVKDVYQPEVLWREIREKRVAAALAFDTAGRPSGYISLFKTAPNPRLWEGGNMVVNPAYKYSNLAYLLMGYYFNPAICQTLDSDGIFGEAVCFHYFTQVGTNKSGLRDCAIELDQLDGSSFKDHKAQSGRVACVLSFLEFTKPPAPVYLPQEYSVILRQLAQPFMPRAFLPADGPLPEAGLTVREDRYYASARTWKVAIREIGADWPVVLEELLAESIRRQVISLQVTLNTASPQLGIAVRQMRERGFFLGGLAPRWFGTDALLMQTVLGKEPDFAGIKLYSKTARELLTIIRSDRDMVRQAEK